MEVKDDVTIIALTCRNLAQNWDSRARLF